jgi:hypothetical protein
VRFTYRSDEGPADKASEKDTEVMRKKGKEEYKHFTFWTRVGLGEALGDEAAPPLAICRTPA